MASSQSLQIQADATNGTIFCDVDAKTATTIKSFSTEASGLVGKSVRIAARYQEDGTLVAVRIWASTRFSSSSSVGFTDTRKFRTAADDYTVSLNYIGGTVGAVSAWGVSNAIWGNPANATGWSVPWTILLPTPVPLGTVTTAFANNAFSMSVVGGTMPATVDVSTTSGSATLVYQVDRSNDVVTISPIDITSSSGLNSLTNGLTAGALVKVYGVPQSDGTLKAYVLAYYTGTTMPAD